MQPEADARPLRDKTKRTPTLDMRMKPLITTLKLTVLAALAAGGLALLPGCGGGGATYQAASNKTLGQELQDLQATYDKGIITQKQYEDTKKRLMKKYTQ